MTARDEAVERMAQVMGEAFLDHERVDHGQVDPRPIPLDCLLDVAARIVDRLDDDERTD